MVGAYQHGLSFRAFIYRYRHVTPCTGCRVAYKAAISGGIPQPRLCQRVREQKAAHKERTAFTPPRLLTRGRQLKLNGRDKQHTHWQVFRPVTHCFCVIFQSVATYLPSQLVAIPAIMFLFPPPIF